MALRSLSQTNDRMTEMQHTLEQTGYNDLKHLKERIDLMYEYRNDTRRRSDNSNDNTAGVVANVCYTHFYKSFKEYEEVYSTPNGVSLGDINGALDTMTSCECNSRQLQGCECVTRNTGNICQCNVRNPIGCDCQSRSGGKYPPPCYCNTRYNGCQCVSRQEDHDCTCNGRCSCNSVNEFSFEDPKPIGYCECVSREYGTACECHGRTIAAVQDCDCQSRTPTAVIHANSNWDSYCGGAHMNSTTYGACSCNSRTSSGDHGYCLCVSRKSESFCQYHVIEA